MASVSGSEPIINTQFVCERCGRTFEVYPSRVKHSGPPKYCSWECRAGSKSEERTCEQCGTEFKVYKSQTKDGNGRYCSMECRGLAHRGKNSPHWNAVECVCKNCGETFYVKQSEFKKGVGKFCSHNCRTDFRKKRDTRVCEQCGKTFVADISNIKRGHGKYCSKECQLTYQRAQTGEKSRHWKNRMVERVCEICGKTFEIPSYNLPADTDKRKGAGKYCSIECKHIGHADSISGEKAPNWQGGISFFPYCEKFNDDFRERVRAFFGRKCFLCGKMEDENGESLSVHHVNYNKQACCEGEDIPEDRLFVPLCRSCHSRTSGGDREEWRLFFMYGIALHTCGTMQTYFHKGEV